jgi:hypothetical protein
MEQPMPPSSNSQSIESAAKSELRKVKVLVVKSVASTFRRLGVAFTREATHLDQSLLTTSQINTLTSDPNLSVSTSTVVVAGPAPTTKPTTTEGAVVTPVPAEQLEETASK